MYCCCNCNKNQSVEEYGYKTKVIIIMNTMIVFNFIFKIILGLFVVCTFVITI